jgi:SAM-dependent methyltransferase
MSAGGNGFCEAGLWQLVESGRYRADLAAWADLAGATGTPVLDLGCGIGRVSHHLNRRGLTTVGLDVDPGLIADFDRTRPEGSPPGIAWDATRLDDPGGPVAGRTFRLVIAPQQLVQVLGGREERMKLLTAIPALLAAGGAAAFAICEDLPDVDIEYPAVPPDLCEVGESVHASQPVAIEPAEASVTALRVRSSLAPDGQVTRTEDSVTLERLDWAGFGEELGAAGLRVERTAEIPPTDRHMGSTLILARAALS